MNKNKRIGRALKTFIHALTLVQEEKDFIMYAPIEDVKYEFKTFSSEFSKNKYYDIFISDGREIRIPSIFVLQETIMKIALLQEGYIESKHDFSPISIHVMIKMLMMMKKTRERYEKTREYYRCHSFN